MKLFYCMLKRKKSFRKSELLNTHTSLSVNVYPYSYIYSHSKCEITINNSQKIDAQLLCDTFTRNIVIDSL